MTYRARGLAPRTALLAAAVLLIASSALGISREEWLKWLEANRKATADFEDGEVITHDEADRIRPFVPPGYQDEMIFEGMEVTVKDPSDLAPPEVYEAATLQFQGQVELSEDGAIQNYVAGQPFDPASLSTDDPMAGYKAIWNFNYRWQVQGAKSDPAIFVWVTRGGDHENYDMVAQQQKNYVEGEEHEVTKEEAGRFVEMFDASDGGSFGRTLYAFYQRIYFSARADLPESGYRMPGSWAKGTEFREITDFTEPFDVRGTAFLVVRYLDPYKSDDGWAYIPTLRRVRRVSTAEKADSLLGTDLTIEDFYGFSGRVLEHDWKYHGRARILVVARARNQIPKFYGPNSWVPKDDWELRECEVIEQIPKRESHPYSSKLLFVGVETQTNYHAEMFDQGGQLWKVQQQSKIWTEDPWYIHNEFQKGNRMSAFHSVQVIDKQNDRGSVIPIPYISYPTNSIAYAKRLMDVNQLSEGR